MMSWFKRDKEDEPSDEEEVDQTPSEEAQEPAEQQEPETPDRLSTPLPEDEEGGDEARRSNGRPGAPPIPTEEVDEDRDEPSGVPGRIAPQDDADEWTVYKATEDEAPATAHDREEPGDALPYADPEPLQTEEEDPSDPDRQDQEPPEDLPYADPEPLQAEAEEGDTQEGAASTRELKESSPDELDLDDVEDIFDEEDTEEAEDAEALDLQDLDLPGSPSSETSEADEAEEEGGTDGEDPDEIAVETEPGQDTPTGPVSSDKETRHLLKAMKKQQKLRAEQELAEAKALEQKAKEMMKQAKERRKLREELEAHTEKVQHYAPELGLDPDRPVTEIPELDEEHLVQAEFTTIQEGRSYVRVLFNTIENRYLYQVIEPQLNQTEEEVLEFLRETLVRTLEARPSLEADDLEDYLTEQIDRAILDHSILVDDVSRERLKYYVVRDFLGYGPIDVLMHDPMIEDISCDGPGIPIYLFHRQYESIRTNVVFEDDYKLDSFVIRLAQRSGKHISIAEPMLDATLPDTSRLQATLSREVTTRGSSFTIRKFRADPLTPPDLVRLGTMSAEMASWYWMAMEQGASLIYAGGTASGKTTTLNAVMQFIPPDRKVVSIEDTREVNLIHENWIAGLTRSGFGGEKSGGREAGEVDMYKLLEAALRQRPEYLLVGEVRGPEAKTLFQAMATGHATYSTMHADSVKSAVYRLENPPISVPRIMLQTLESISVQVQARINQRMVRRLKETTEVVGIDPDTGDLLTNTVFRWDPSTDSHRFYGKSQILEKIAEKNNLELREVMEEMRNRQRVIEWMVEKGIRHITDVSDVLSTYYAQPDALLARIKKEGDGGITMALEDHDPDGDVVPEIEAANLDEPDGGVS